MKMLVAKVKDGYGCIRDRYINPDKVRAIGNTYDGTAVWCDNGNVINVLDSASELAKQWEHCTDEIALAESEVGK